LSFNNFLCAIDTGEKFHRNPAIDDFGSNMGKKDFCHELMFDYSLIRCISVDVFMITPYLLTYVTLENQVCSQFFSE